MQDESFSLVPHSRGLDELIEKTKAYIRGAKSAATLRAYRTDFEDFTNFCLEHALPFLPVSPTTVALYIADRAGSLAAGTITRRLTAITKAYQAAACSDSPASSRHFVVSETLKGIRRAIGNAQHGKDPLLAADIRRIVESCPEGLAGLRDKALVLIGFAGAFRRAELATIDFAEKRLLRSQPVNTPFPSHLLGFGSQLSKQSATEHLMSGQRGVSRKV